MIDNCKVLIAFYSAYGHLYQIAQGIEKGCNQVAGTTVTMKRIPETWSQAQLQSISAPLKGNWHSLPELTPEELKQYDCIFLGGPTRMGTISCQMKTFFERLNPMKKTGELCGKVTSLFGSSGTQHGGHEMSLLTSASAAMTLGMVLVGIPSTVKEIGQIQEMAGVTNWGVTTVAGPVGPMDNQIWPKKRELEVAELQGKYVTQIAQKLLGFKPKL